MSRSPEHMREPVFVPETKGILPLLSEMRTLHNQIAHRRRRVRRDGGAGHAGRHRRGDRRRDRRRVRPRAQVHPAGGRQRVGRRRASRDRRSDRARNPGSRKADEYETVAGWMLARLGHIPIPESARPGTGTNSEYRPCVAGESQGIRITGPVDGSAGRGWPRWFGGDNVRLRSDRLADKPEATSPMATEPATGETARDRPDRRYAVRVSPTAPRPPHAEARSLGPDQPPTRSRTHAEPHRQPRPPSPATSSTRTSTCSRSPLLMEMVERPETPKRFKEAVKVGRVGPSRRQETLPDLIG